MRKIIAIVITVIITVLAFGQVQKKIIILKSGEAIIAEIITSTEKQIIIRLEGDKVKVIDLSEISSIQDISAPEISQKKRLTSETEDTRPYLKIPLFQHHERTVKIGVITSTSEFQSEGFEYIYRDKKAFSWGILFEVDHSPLVAFTFKYFNSSIENSGLDTIGWVEVDTLGGIQNPFFDLKWSQNTFFTGPRFHYQYSLLNAYADIGLIYTTVSEKGKYWFDSNPGKYEYNEGRAGLGFCYAIGIQLITPYSISANFEYCFYKMEKIGLNLGQKFIGGGFQFVIPIKEQM